MRTHTGDPHARADWERAALAAIRGGLASYLRAHPGSEAEVYREGTHSVFARVVDPAFAGLSKSERADRVWNHLRGAVADEYLTELTSISKVCPGETSNGTDVRFEDHRPFVLDDGAFRVEPQTDGG